MSKKSITRQSANAQVRTSRPSAPERHGAVPTKRRPSTNRDKAVRQKRQSIDREQVGGHRRQDLGTTVSRDHQEDPAYFISQVFPSDGPGYVVLFALPAKQSRSFLPSDLDGIRKDVETRSKKHNLYLGVCLQAKSQETYKRGKSTGASLVPAMWADIDFKSRAHKNTNLPPDEKAAMSLLEEFPLKPSLVIHSGHGLQPLWLLKDPIIIKNEKQRNEASSLARDFHDALNALAKRHEWTVDKVPDLARNLRIPGSTNRKPGLPPVPVRLIQENPSARYTTEDFRKVIAKLGIEKDKNPRGANPLAKEKVRLGKKAKQFLLEGAPVGNQRNQAVAAARNLWRTGCSVERASALIWEALMTSPVDPDKEPWTEKAARDLVKDIYESEPAPLPPLRNKNVPRNSNSDEPNNDENFDSDVVSGTMADVGKFLPKVQWIWQDWIPRGFISIIAGAPGCGKSMLAMRIAGSIIAGKSWPNGSKDHTPRGSVLWLDTESSQVLLHSRMKSFGYPAEKMIVPVFRGKNRGMPDLNLSREQTWGTLRRMIEKERPKLVIVDSLRGSHSGDENDSQISSLLKRLSHIARDFNVGILVVHHVRKAGQNENARVVSLDRVRGSSAITAWARVVIAAEGPLIPKGNGPEMRMRVIKSNLGLPPNPLGFEIGTTAVEFGEAPREDKKESKVDRAVMFLRKRVKGKPVLSADIEKERKSEGIAEKTLQRAKGQIGIKAGKTGKGNRWELTLPTRGRQKGKKKTRKRAP